ncbi:CRISPR-associated endonuclease Cas3'' [Halostagnicola kamekurae]|uniref:CRISPR-associated endonuclease Cas3-HD n=1 Tax=Halostagnicola kamekurae TaxID=619731 RepID=A0A1I6V8B0_9EURY|nr:CRISPR-associated endonuclease Cas3'' [Halostagnicola kamekurae]SFT09988.1 CRISPR-associated endonuclease Cas3-HD [Halostagnicola kamekurae]
MTRTLDSGREILSHPSEINQNKKPLWNHLTGVSERAAAAISEHSRFRESLVDAEKLLGLAHDFAKATPAFQQYIRPNESHDSPKHHARLGSLVAYFFLQQNGYDRETRLAGVLAVAKHHGDVPDAAGYIRRTFDEPRINPVGSNQTIQAIEQAKTIDDHAETFARDLFREAVFEGAWDNFLEKIGDSSDSPILTDIIEDAGERGGLAGELEVKNTRFDESIYTRYLVLFGSLTFADKTDAARIDTDDSRLWGEYPSLDKLETHLNELGGETQNDIETQLNEVRAEVQNEIPRQTRGFLESNQSVATLTLPTGYGKTFAGLLAGLTLCDERDGRLVYALPFTSIIDQTSGTLQEVFETDPSDNLLTVHHHLAETRTDTESEEEEETDEHASHEVLLAESWRTGLTLTTFVQLFESLAGPRNGQSLKLSALQGSTVIIDEPQAIPQHWWPIIRKLIDMLTERFDAQVLLMTATQPSLVEDSFELISSERLLEIEQSAFSGDPPSRVQYQLHPTALVTENEDQLSHLDAARLLAETVVSGDTTLAICNTIESTRILTREFIDSTSEYETDPISVSEVYAEQLDEDEIGGLSATKEYDGKQRPSIERGRLVRAVVEELRIKDTATYLHLTTRVRPCDRQFLLAVANDLAGMDIPFALISTQLVEAGVDISFDTVFRDFAPLDSIVQAAGRCNRSYERAPETGVTTVWQLEPPGEGNTSPSTAVYAPNRNRGETDLLMHTRSVLETVQSEHGTAFADEVLAKDAIERYHDTVGERVHSVSESNDLVTAFEQADGKTLCEASLIERRQSVEVYVCRTREEHDSATTIEPLMKERKFDEVDSKRDELASIRVSIPVPRANTDAASGILSLEPLIDEEEKRHDPERILHASNSIFDPEFGVQPSEYGVEDRFF